MSLAKKVRSRRKKRRLKSLRNTLLVSFVCGGVAYFVYERTSAERSSDEQPRLRGNEKGTVEQSQALSGNHGLVFEKPTDIGQHNDSRNPLSDTLRLDFKFNYLPNRKDSRPGRASREVALASDEPYYLGFDLYEPCYLYIVQQTSSGNCSILFPNRKYSSQNNPVRAGHLRIPEGRQWIYLDSAPGLETVYLLAVRERAESLEKLLTRKDTAADGTEMRSLESRILQHLVKHGKIAQNLPGLVFSKYQFENEGGAERLTTK